MSTEIYGILPDPPGFLPKDQPATAHVKFRPYETEDAKFILHSWMKSMRGQYRDSRDDHYYDGMQARILSLSKRESTKVVVACDRERQHFIYGWCVAEDIPHGQDFLVAHYIFVKNTYRRQGIGTALLEAHGWAPGMAIQITHWNYCLKDIKRVVKLHYNPWRLDDQA